MKKLRMIPVLLATLIAGACGTATGEREPEAASSSDPDRGSVEVAGPEPRLAVTYDGGVLVLRARDGEVLLDQPVEGFVRANPAGDDRHVLLSTGRGFEALDLGSWTHSHGDHGHSFTGEPHLTGTVVEAEEPGHVVHHGGHTVLFDDGTGSFTELDPHDLEHGTPETESGATDQAHHGVAVRLEDGNLIHTVGDSETRTGVRLVTAAGNELAASDDCPGVHGEAFAGDVAVFGCEDGALLVDGRTITKADSPDAYGRIGNQAGSGASPVLLGDYKTDPDAELERPTRVSLIDTRTARVRLVDVASSYTFRSLGRGPDGEGLVLGTDGRLRIIDVTSGKITAAIPVLKAWREPVDWQQPRPALEVLDGTAYVTDPAASRIHVVDLGSGKVTDTLDLPVVPNELVASAG
ncbi:zinc metallochaperone AztD [Nocardioides jensenii]|uniref:zinc metallochaperone AztD n=1 Tax=Nocardioides jensenii TaxID=1843 RepID=UPI0008311D05|nr:zinc metallochaperone AztD [Nocardioides jensenii]